MNDLHCRILGISKKLKLAHIGSCLTSVNIIDEIYKIKGDDEKFILSSGHAGLALYVVLEKYYGFDAEKLYLKHGMHPNRDIADKIYCSTGSLGMGLMIALGMAVADRTQNVYCLISDGECFEGSIWEVSNATAKYNVTNLKIYLNYNGLAAYQHVDENILTKVHSILPITIRRTHVEQYGLNGLSAHYVIL